MQGSRGGSISNVRLVVDGTPAPFNLQSAASAPAASAGGSDHDNYGLCSRNLTVEFNVGVDHILGQSNRRSIQVFARRRDGFRLHFAGGLFRLKQWSPYI